MFIVYQSQHEQAKKGYPDGPATIRRNEALDGEMTYTLHIGPASDLIVAKSSFPDDLLTFAERHGWEVD